MNSRSALPLQIALVAIGTFFVGVAFDWPVVRLIAKPIPVLCAIAWLMPLASRDARLVALGLGLSFVGDICLEASPGLFVPGLVAFLLAHVAYVVAYVGRTRALHLMRFVPTLAYCVAVFLWLEPHLGPMRGPVIAYVAVISVMVWRALAQIGERPRVPALAWYAAIGAVLFALSDTLVAYNRFIGFSMAAKIVLMLQYWAAQALIAKSVEREG